MTAMHRPPPPGWLPQLVELLARRPDLAGVGVTGAAEVVST